MSKPSKNDNDSALKPKTIFDHAKHIRQVQSPDYYTHLSAEDKKTFNHFMLLRALSMDPALVEDIAGLYQYLDIIPSPQFYTLLIAIVPRNYKYFPWVKSKKYNNDPRLIEIVAERFSVPKFQANEYINVLLFVKDGKEELNNICVSFGMSESEIKKIFENL